MQTYNIYFLIEIGMRHVGLYVFVYAYTSIHLLTFPMPISSANIPLQEIIIIDIYIDEFHHKSRINTIQCKIDVDK